MSAPAVLAYADRVVASAPPLSPAQVDRIVAVLRSASKTGGAS